MSYIANGCNDCSTIDFGSNGLLSGGGNQTNFLTPTQNGMFDNSSANQFMYQQPQQVQQPQVQQQVQQVQMPQQQAPMVQMPQQLPQQPKVQATVKVNPNYPPVQQPEKNQSLQGIIGHYLVDNAFILTIAFLVANAWHTTIKYYIDQAIKFNGGTPTYYIVYAVLATLVSIFLSSLKA